MKNEIKLSLLMIQGVAAAVATGAASIAQIYPADKRTRAISVVMEKLGWVMIGVTSGRILELASQLLSGL